ncbi:Immunoglobulin superfamily member 1 [Chelonia mydas]|nr:Immunoglobulin superfamily member 1 [Chelonia mydas]
MILSLCLLLPALSPSSQEICSAPGDLPAPTLYLSQTSAWPGDSVQLQCSMISQLRATRIAFCQDGEEVSSQRGLLGKLTYDSDHAVSGGSSGNYSCGYEIKNSNNQVNRLQLSPPQHLITTSALPAPTLYLNQTSTQSGDSVQLQCSVFSWDLATRIIFFKDGEEVSSQRSLLGILTDDFDHVVSGDSSGNYACAYEIKDSDNQVTRSQLSPAQHLSITGKGKKSKFQIFHGTEIQQHFDSEASKSLVERF